MDGRKKEDVIVGSLVKIMENKNTNDPIEGIVKDILTSSSFHPHGIKVRLENGTIGRVKEIIKNQNENIIETSEKNLSPYEMIMDLESKLRQIINIKLMEVTNEWWKQRIPPTVYEKWKKRKSDESHIVPQPKSRDLIDYSDLGDLKDIILRADNWKEKFQSIFKNETIFAGSMALIIPIRNQIAHRDERSLDEQQIDVLSSNYRLLRNLMMDFL